VPIFVVVVSGSGAAACDQNNLDRDKAPVPVQANNAAAVTHDSSEKDPGATPPCNPDGAEAAAGPSIAIVVTGHPTVVDAIATARCAREQRCGRIGVHKNWASSESCRQEIAAKWREELDAFGCPAGVVQNELEECIDQIQNEHCANPFYTLKRIAACHPSDVCREPADAH
jgi:hypothetical protein